MKKVLHMTLLLVLGAFACPVVYAQDYDDLLSTVLTSPGGEKRAMGLIELSTMERKAGRYREAVEFAILGSSEAEKHGLGQHQGRALMELAKAHQAKGDMEHAIGAGLRATLVDGTTHSTLRTDALMHLAELYVAAMHPQKALEHLEEARNSTGAGHIDKGDYVRVETAAKASILGPAAMEEHCTRWLAESITQDDPELEFALRTHLATALARQGKNAAALENEERAMRMAIARDKALDAGICANNKAELYNRLGQKQRSIEAYNQGLILVEDLPRIRLNMTMNAVHAMVALGQRDAAMRTLEEAKHIARNESSDRELPRVSRTEAALHLAFGDLHKAQLAALDALNKAEELRDDKGQAEACDLLAMVFERMQLDHEARQFDRRAREIELRMVRKQDALRADHEAQLLRLQRIEREQMDLLNREQRKEARLRQLALDAENHEKQLALLVYEKQLQEAASREAAMIGEQATRELLLAQATLEAERQQRTIQELDNSRMLQSLSLGKLEAEQKEQYRAMELLEQQSQVMEAESRAIKANEAKQKAVRNLSIGLALVALVFGAWMLWAWSVTTKKKRLVQEQSKRIAGINSELEDRNKDIESSLGYARTVQSTIVPSEQDLRELMPESFLMYKPLHSVSGDLPYVRRSGDRIYVAAIDCTGHGVPAAMMTFVAYYGLEQLVLQHPHATSADLLDMLHEHVRKAMDGRSESGLYNDGFDIGLCIIDLQCGKLCYAGAQLPLVLVREGVAQRFKGDLFPLGDDRFERTSGYKAHGIDLHHGDSLFLFSDGIIHQFGGPEGRKKFSMKRLTALFERTAAMDLLDVKNETEREFLEWKNDHPQTDDVLLIGLKYAA